MKALKPFIVVAVALAVIYTFPRLLLNTLGMDPADPWLNYLYHYGFGIMIFLIGLFVILKTGSCELGRGRDTKWFIYLSVGMVIYASIHAIWIYMAQSAPYLGGS